MCIDSVVSKDIVNECLLHQLAICTIIAYLRLNIVRRRPLVNLANTPFEDGACWQHVPARLTAFAPTSLCESTRPMTERLNPGENV